MALFKIFKKKTSKNTDNLGWTGFEFSEEQVRVILFRDCEWQGRKLVFDSAAVRKVSLDSLSEKNPSTLHLGVSSSSLQSRDSSFNSLRESGRIRKTSTDCSTTEPCTNSLQFTTSLEDIDGNTKSLAPPAKPCEDNATKYKFIETSNGFGYQFLQYKQRCSDMASIGEMVFGSVALTFRGTSSKVHTLRTSKGTTNIMCTHVFYPPMRPQRHSNISRGSQTSSSAVSSTSDGLAHHLLDTSSRFAPPGNSLELPRHENIEVDSGYNTGDYSIGSNISNLGAHTYSTHFDMQFTDHHSNSSFGCNPYNMNRRLLRNVNASLDFWPILGTHCGSISGAATSGCSYSSNVPADSSHHYYDTSCMTHSVSECGRTNSAGTDESYSNSVSYSKRTKLGLAVIIELTSSQEKEMQLYLLEHMPLLDSMIWRLRDCIQRAYCQRNMFVSVMVEGCMEAARWIGHLLCPSFTLPPPLWLHESSSESSLSSSFAELNTLSHSSERSDNCEKKTDLFWKLFFKTDPNPKRCKTDIEKFVRDFCDLLAVMDTKNTNFFLSALITGVLTHHLGWILSIRGRDADGIGSPCSALWTQLGEMYGAIGSPPRLAQTVVVGKNISNNLNTVLNVLSYFTRYSEVERKTENLIKIEREDSILGEKIIKLTNSKIIFNTEPEITVRKNCKQNDSSTEIEMTNFNPNFRSRVCKNETSKPNKSVVINNIPRGDTLFCTDCSLSLNANLNFKTFLNDPLCCANCQKNLTVSDQFNSCVENTLCVKTTRIAKCASLCLHNVDTAVNVPNTEPSGLKRTKSHVINLKGIDAESLNGGQVLPTTPNDLIHSSVTFDTSSSVSIYYHNLSRSIIDNFMPKDNVPNLLNTLTSQFRCNPNEYVSKVPPIKVMNFKCVDDQEYFMKNNVGGKVVFVLGDGQNLGDIKSSHDLKKCQDVSEIDVRNTQKLKEECSVEPRMNSMIKQIQSLESTVMDTNLPKSIKGNFTRSLSEPPIASSSNSTQPPSPKCPPRSPCHQRLKKHSGVKFNFEQYPQIATNYMMSKNLDIENHLFLEKGLKMNSSISTNFGEFSKISFTDAPSECTCGFDDCSEITLQTPSNASELESTSDLPQKKQAHYAVEKVHNPTGGGPEKFNFAHNKLENTLVIDPIGSQIGSECENESEAQNMAECKTRNYSTTVLKSFDQNPRRIGTKEDISKKFSKEQLGVNFAFKGGRTKTMFQKMNTTALSLAEVHPLECSDSNQSRDAHSIGNQNENAMNLFLMCLPLPRSSMVPPSNVPPAGYKYSMIRAGHVGAKYMAGAVLQGITQPFSEWSCALRRDLALSTRHNPLEQPMTEAICIVADMDNWTVHTVSSSSMTISGLTGLHASLNLGTPVGPSQLITDMLDSVLQLWRLHTPPQHCLQHIENKLQEIYMRSFAFSELLLATDFCDMKFLTSALGLQLDDVPLLFAIASTHTPQVTHKYGVTFQ